MAADGTPSTGDSPFAAQIRSRSASWLVVALPPSIYTAAHLRHRERYRLDEDTAPPRLISHAELLRDTLRARELDEVARDSAADLFTVPVTGYGPSTTCAGAGCCYERSGRSAAAGGHRPAPRTDGETSHRREWTSTGLIRLLAAEQQWLRLPPLHFEIAAELLSQVCVSCLDRSPPAVAAGPGPDGDVCRRPQRLVELLPKLLDRRETRRYWWTRCFSTAAVFCSDHPATHRLMSSISGAIS